MTLHTLLSKTLFAALTVMTALPAYASGDAALTPHEVLNRRRTQVTLMLYAPVMAEMLNQGDQETRSWMTKIRQKVDSGFEPAKIFAERRKCLTYLLEEWQLRTQTGKFGSTRDLLEDLFKAQQAQASNCASWLPSIAGKAAEDEVHGMYLNSLMLAEERFSIHDRKMAHLAALNILTTRPATQYFGAAQDVAFFYMDDKDKVVVEEARNWVRRLPGVQKFRETLDVIRPDMLMVGAVGAAGSLRLIDRFATLAPRAFSTPTQIKVAIASVGAHLGVISASAAPEKNSLLQRRFAVRGGDKAAADVDIGDWSAGAVDILPDTLLKQVAQRSRRRYLGLLKDTDFDFLSFLVSVQSQVPGVNPLNSEQRIMEMKSLSEEVGRELGKKQLPFLERIQNVRSLLISQSFVSSYIKNQAGLVPYLNGDGGNCVAQTQLFIALLYSHRDLLEKGWELAVEFRPQHRQPVLLNKSERVSIDLVSGTRARYLLHGYFHPLSMVEGYLRFKAMREQNSSFVAEPWESYLLSAPADISKSEIREILSKDRVLEDVQQTRFTKPMHLRPLIVEEDVPDAATLMNHPISDETPRGERFTNYVRRYLSAGGADAAARTVVTLISPRDYPEALKSPRWSPQDLPVFEIKVNKTDGLYITQYDLTFRSDADRDSYAKKTSPDERAVFLETLLNLEIRKKRTIVGALSKMSATPRAAADVPADFETRKNSYLETDGIVNRVMDIKMVRTAKQQLPFSAYTFTTDYLADIESSVQSYLPLRNLLDEEIALMEGLGGAPETIAKMLDDDQIPAANKKILLAIVTRDSYTGLAQYEPKIPRDVKQISILYRQARARNLPYENMIQAISSPRRIGISEKKFLASADSSPSIQIKKTTTPAKLRFEDLDLAGKPKNSRECSSADSSGRCREQSIVWINPASALVYVSPQTFFSIYATVIQQLWSPIDRIRISNQRYVEMLAPRWTPEMESLFLSQVYGSFAIVPKINWETAAPTQRWAFENIDHFIRGIEHGLLMRGRVPSSDEGYLGSVSKKTTFDSESFKVLLGKIGFSEKFVLTQKTSMKPAAPASLVDIELQDETADAQSKLLGTIKKIHKTTPTLAAMYRCDMKAASIFEALAKKQKRGDPPPSVRPQFLKCLETIIGSSPKPEAESAKLETADKAKAIKKRDWLEYERLERLNNPDY